WQAMFAQITIRCAATNDEDLGASLLEPQIGVPELQVFVLGFGEDRYADSIELHRFPPHERALRIRIASEPTRLVRHEERLEIIAGDRGLVSLQDALRIELAEYISRMLVGVIENIQLGAWGACL